MPASSSDLDRWVEQELISADQRDAILEFERQRAASQPEEGPGRFANAVSTVGAAVAIAAVAGIVTLFSEDWSSGQTMLAALVGAVVMIAAAWFLVRNGWGAPGGLCALCGIALMPVALGFAADAAGWWPEDEPTGLPNDLDREREQVIGIALLLALLPGLAIARLKLRQVWAAAPVALWFGVMLLWTNPFENIGVALAQVAVGALVAGLTVFLWSPEAGWSSAAWWLQLGGLVMIGIGIVFSAIEDPMIYPLLGVVAAALVFGFGVVRNRTVWIVAGAVPAIVPAARIVFDLFEGIVALLIVALAGMALAFVPLLLWRRRQAAS